MFPCARCSSKFCSLWALKKHSKTEHPFVKEEVLESHEVCNEDIPDVQLQPNDEYFEELVSEIKIEETEICPEDT